MSGWFGLLGLPTLARVAAGVLDSFDRDDSATSLGDADTGQTWEVLGGTWGISNNQGYIVSPNGGSYAVIDAGLADCTVKADAIIPGAVPDFWGVCFRLVDVESYWLLLYDSNVLTLYKVVDGEVEVPDACDWTPSVSTTYELKIVLVGDSITLYVDDVEKFTVTDSALATAVKHGLWGTSTTIRYDNFSVQAES